MIEPGHEELSVRRQASLLGVNRNRLEARPRAARASREADLKTLAELDRLHTRWPFYGQRKLLEELRRAGLAVNRKRVRRLMRVAGIEAVAPKRWTSWPQASHPKHPYLLRDMVVEEADQVWCSDITYIPMEKGHAYLVAVMDWRTRAVLSWKLSNTLDASFCLEALEEAFAVAGRAPQIINTDQGCQFTCQEWVAAVEARGSRVSMDGRGRWLDNVFIERLWRSLKCEQLYLGSYAGLRELEAAVARWMDDYNHHRIHQALGYTTPWENYRPDATLASAA